MLDVQRSGSAVLARNGGRAGGGGDAFSDLFAGVYPTGASGVKNMALAARLNLEK